MIDIARYRAFLALPDMRAILATLLVARMPIGMMGLSTLMFIRNGTGSFAIAGSVVGTYLIAAAVSAPAIGRVIDRIGPRTPLIVTGVLYPFAILLLIAAIDWRWPLVVVYAGAVFTGLTQVPITSITRTLWRHRFDDDGHRQMAYAIDAILIELNFTLGPVIVAGIQAIAHPRVALFAALGTTIVGLLLFLAAPILKYWKQEPPGERHFLGPLTDARLLIAFATVFGLTFTFGVLEVAYPAFATMLAMPAIAGVFLAINSVGSAFGGAVYGSRSFSLAVERQFPLFTLFMGLAVLAHWPAAHPAALAVVAFIAGCAIAPGMTSHMLLVSKYAPAKYATEAFTWSSTCIIAGLGTGMAVSGPLVERVGLFGAYLAGAVVAVLAAGMALLLRPRHANAQH